MNILYNCGINLYYVINFGTICTICTILLTLVLKLHDLLWIMHDAYEG